MGRPFEDLAAEAAVNAGILRFGRDAFVDCEGLVDPGKMTLEVNQVVFAAAAEHYAGGTDRPLDYPALLSAAKRLGLDGALSAPEARKHVRLLAEYPVDLASVRPEAAKLLKLDVGRRLKRELDLAGERLAGITGDEPLDEIMGYAEKPVFDFGGSLSGGQGGTQQIAEGIDDWLQNILDNPCDNLGVPTPFPLFNKLTGGGFRRGGISVVAARPKQGKTTWLDNTALHVAGPLGIPVFNVDTEMTREGHWARLLSHLTSIPIDAIEHGRLDRSEARLVGEKAAWLHAVPYHYKSVIDDTFEEQVAAMRRWVVKTVGVDADGVRNPCLVLYDYLQLTDPREFGGNKFAEYQILGFQMVALARIAKRYDIPIVSMLQLNKEGWASGSDRIVWKCDSFTTLHRKTHDEVTADGKDNGNAYLHVKASRYGPGSEDGDHVNLHFDTATSRLTEGKTKFEADRDRGKKPSTSKGFQTDHDPEEDDAPW